jgi:hypothetical protein
MSTPSKPFVPVEINDAPPDLLAKAGPLLAELDKATKAATGTLQQVLRIMTMLVTDTKAGSLNQQTYQDLKNAINRYMKDVTENPSLAANRPAVLADAVDWVQAYVAARGVTPEKPAAAAPAPTAAPAARGAGVTAKDGFESGPKARMPSLGGDPAPAPAAAQPGEKSEKDLESFKAWMKNPALGKLKG